MCRVLNMSEFSIFVNLYDRVLNMRWDAVMERL